MSVHDDLNVSLNALDGVLRDRYPEKILDPDTIKKLSERDADAARYMAFRELLFDDDMKDAEKRVVYNGLLTEYERILNAYNADPDVPERSKRLVNRFIAEYGESGGAPLEEVLGGMSYNGVIRALEYAAGVRQSTGCPMDLCVRPPGRLRGPERLLTGQLTGSCKAAYGVL